MNAIPNFAEALQRFRGFLAHHGHPDEVFWVFREDFWQVSSTHALVQYPPPVENDALVHQVFAAGQARGLVEIKALAATGDKVAATVWFPKYPHEEVQGWGRGMRLAISAPLPRAKMVVVTVWGLLRFLPQYRHYQARAVGIGTRAWATA